MISDPRFVAKQDQLQAGLRRRLVADGVDLEDILQLRAINIAVARIATGVTAVLTDAAGDPEASRMGMFALTSILHAMHEITRTDRGDA